MRILVVGSLGFIGSHCVDFFSKEHEVWGCDVVQNCALMNYFPIDPVESDFQRLFQSQEFDVCINCSGAASVPLSIENPSVDFELNTINVFKLLSSIRQISPSCRFITMSSAAIYGNPESLPVRVEDKVNPVSPYGFHKVMAEMICEEFHRFWGTKTCCVRIFSAYGPRLKKQLFWDMYNKIQSEQNIVLWGTGRESRDFIYIKDLVRVIELIIKKGSFEGEIYNVANGEQRCIAEVAELFIKILESDTEVTFNNETRKGDPLNWEADITAIKALGYQPEYTLEEGIKEYVDWVKSI